MLIIAVLLIAAAPSKHFTLERGKREPIVITSHRMEADQLDEIVTFTGDVILKKESVTMNADSVRVVYDPPNKGVKEIEARGNVTVRQEGRIARANKAVYYSQDEKIVLTGDAKVIENENQVGGERITLFIRENRSSVEGGKVLFYQEKKSGDVTIRPLRRPGK